ncbi:MAG: hypothetical protein NUW24_10560 [Anaerolineae bacterium]|jgi:hypothetical protein|nr:hypothetical protein [Anaerolineae bacterium]MDH7472858.1 hypothetical protein [Anaerolineae bacterium]
MNKVLSFTIVALIAAMLIIGMLLANTNSDQPSTVEREMANLRLETARRLQVVTIAFRVGLAAITLLTLGGLGLGAVRFVLRRTDTIYPDKAGLYPIREGRIGRIRFFHDPNRAPMPTTLYSAQGVSHLTAPGFEADQLRVTGQAQAAQALRAASSGNGIDLQSQRLVEAIIPPERRLSRPIPPAEVWDIEPSHVARLLEEVNDE